MMMQKPRNRAFAIFSLALGFIIFWGYSLSTAAVPLTTNSWQWTAGGELNQQRYGHTATRLSDGRVVVIGGISDINNATRLNSAEVYDPVTNQWTLYPNGSSQFRNQHTATLLNDGRILVIGGDADFGGVVNSAEIFDPIAGTWTAVTSFGAIAQHTAVLLNDGAVLVFGGIHGYIGSSPDYNLDAWRYNAGADTWSYGGYPELYEATGVKQADGQVFAMARGWGGIKLYNPNYNSWSIIPNMPDVEWDSLWGVSLNSINFLGAGVYIAGYGEAIVYNGAWHGIYPMLHDRMYHTGTSVEGGVLLVGGVLSDYSAKLAEAEMNGESAGTLQVARTGHTATALQDGRVLVVGGLGEGTTVLSSTEIGAPAGSGTATPTSTPTITPTPTLTPTPTATPPTGGVIRGRVWLDDGWLLSSQGAYGPDIWGIQEAGEPGISGVTVILDTPGADGDWGTQGDNISYQQITNASGDYAFTNLFISKSNGDPMPYAVQFEPAPGYRFVDANVGNDDQIDSDAENEVPVALDRWVARLETFLSPTTPAQNHVDAGLFRNSVSGRVWLDANNNGIQDPDETGMENLGVGLVRGDVSGGAPVATVTTDSDGRFTFTHIRPENHLLTVYLPNHTPSPANQGDNPELDSDGRLSDCHITPHCIVYIPIRPSSNQIVTAQDFGFIPQGKITTQVAQVTLTNGVPHMQPSAGITLTLIGWYPSMPTMPLGTKASDSTGLVQFAHLNSRTYRQLGQSPDGFLMYPSDFYLNGNPMYPMAQTNPWVIDLNSGDQRLVEIELRFFFYQPDASSVATPANGGSVSTGGSQLRATAVAANPITLSVPPNAVTETITLHLTQVTADAGYLPHPQGYIPTRFGALWDVTVGDAQRYGYALQAPATLTLPFDPASLLWQESANLHLLWWNAMAGQWEMPVNTCGAGEPAIDMTSGWLTAELCQAGQYGLFETGWQIYLPLTIAH